MKKMLLLLLVITSTFDLSFAQKDVKTSFETIKEQCKDLPVNQRVRVTVARFSVTTAAPSELGGNLTTMLTNALQGVNCYNVLESLINKEDMNEEIKYGESEYANKKSTAKKGKQLGAQVIVTGEITEYNSKNSGVRVGLVKVGSNKAKIGFILKLVNPETREIIYSQSINVEGKTAGNTEVGLFGVNVASSANSDPAVANACEQGVIKAVEYLAEKRTSLSSQFSTADGNGDKSTVNETEIKMTNANFTTFNDFANLLSAIPAYKSVEKSFKEGVATYMVSHTGTTSALLEEINKKSATKYEVTGFETGAIEMKAR